jgi:hypothetical protein
MARALSDDAAEQAKLFRHRNIAAALLD